MKEDVFSLTNFCYQLPPQLIAQRPLPRREEARLLIVERKSKCIKEEVFKNIINFLEEEDVLVLNDTKVIRARLWARRMTGAKIEILLTRKIEENVWAVLAKPARRLKLGEVVLFDHKDISAQVLERNSYGEFILRFSLPVEDFLNEIGEVPLPPYIKEKVEEESYQTVFSKEKGAVASPTAGLHFSLPLLERIKARGVKVVFLTLHCSAFTFRPVKAEDIRKHRMQKEFFIIPPQTAYIINEAKRRKRRVFSVGTTSTRALESSVNSCGEVIPQRGEASLYIYPGYNFKTVDALITNFHTPRSTNLILVASFAGLDLVKKAYQYAIDKRFRFFSFGDAMLII